MAETRTPDPRSGGEPAPQPHLRPGDQAPPGTPGTGENICGNCGGSGKVEGRDCPTCEGTGYVTTGIGGA